MAKTLASGGQGDNITLWNTATGKKRTLSGTTSSIADGNTLAFSPDGQWLVSGEFRGNVGIWEVNSADPKERVLPKRHTNAVTAVAISPDGQMIATGSSDKRIILWDLETLRPHRILYGHENAIFGLSFSDDGRHLYACSRDNTMRLWDVASGVTIKIYSGHSAGVWAVARRGDTCYTASDDGTVRRWNTSLDGYWAWDLPTGGPNSAAIAPDGTFIVVGFNDGALRLLVTQSGAIIFEETDAHTDSISRISFSPKGTHLATAGMDGVAKLWRIDSTGATTSLTLLHQLADHTEPIHAVAFSPDNRMLVTAGYDGRVGLFDVASGSGRLFEAHEDDIANATFSADGQRLLTAGIMDSTLRIWDLDQNPPDYREIAKTRDRIMWSALRPDGGQIAVVGRDQVVALYDPADKAAPPRRLVGHEQTVFRAIYSPDGAQLATVGGDMTMRLWDLEAGKALFTIRLPTEFQRPSPLYDFDFRCTPDGHCWIAVPLAVGRLALYRLPYENPPKSITDPTPSPTTISR